MTDQVFVERERELARMDVFLERALAGSGQICFVTGEPGSGKTALMQQFGHRAQARHMSLVVAGGDCSAQTGISDAYLPFREVLSLLTGNVEDKLAVGGISAESASRLRKILARSALLLLEVAPELIDTLVPCGNIIAALGKAVGEQAGVEEKLKAVIKRPSAKLELLPTSVEQNHIFQQCTNYLCRLAAERPLVISLDDLQWADASSVSLLFHLGRRITSSPILILGAYRPVEVALGRNGRRHPLEKVVAEFSRFYGDVVVDLAARDERDVRRFVDAYVDTQPNRFSYSFREALCRYTDGNPLFLEELLREMQARGDIMQDDRGRWIEGPNLDWDALPTRVESVIGELIARLDIELRHILTTASVEGQAFTAEAVARVESVAERVLIRQLSEELSKRHRLVEPLGIRRLGPRGLSTYRFWHSLIQKYLYDSLDEVERAYLHKDVGDALEVLYQDHLDEVTVQLAWHFLQAGDRNKAARYLRQAGALAAARYAHQEAAQHFSRALELVPEDDLAGRFQLLLAREAVYLWQGMRDSQAQDLRELAELAERMGDTRAGAEVGLRRANFARLTGDFETALAHAQQAVALAEAAGDSPLEARGYAMWGRILIHVGDYREAREWLQLARELAETGGDRELVAQATFNLSRVRLRQDRLREARQLAQEAQIFYRELSDRRGEFDCLAMIGTVDCRLGNYEAAWNTFDQALKICRMTGVRIGEAFVLGNLGAARLDLGDYPAAREHLEKALAICREVDYREGEAFNLGMLGMVHQRLGDPDTAQEYYHRALEITGEIGDRSWEGYLLTYLGHALVDLGDLPAADQALREALRNRLSLDERSGMVVDDLAGLARVAQAQERDADALSYAEEALAWMEANGTESVEYPVLAYLICYEVLRSHTGNDSADQARARAALQAGYDLLQEKATRIQDGEMRRLFLENVPYNRQLAYAWAAEGLDG